MFAWSSGASAGVISTCSPAACDYQAEQSHSNTCAREISHHQQVQIDYSEDGVFTVTVHSFMNTVAGCADLHPQSDL